MPPPCTRSHSLPHPETKEAEEVEIEEEAVEEAATTTSTKQVDEEEEEEEEVVEGKETPHHTYKTIPRG